MWNDRMLKVAMTIRNLPIPVIAMVEGACVGGGHELMLWCDLVITAEDAIFGQTGARVGACPTVGATQYIAKLIGERRAKEMIFLCKRYSGKEAAEIGLANIAVPASELRRHRGGVPGDRRLQRPDHPGDQGGAQLRLRPALCVLAARHGAARQHLGHRGVAGGHERLPREAQADFQQFREERKAELDTWKHNFDEGFNQSDKSRGMQR
jgi:enoyl-CoA hydratase/carnithine racemase